MDKVDPKKLILRENVTEYLTEDELQNNPRFKTPERYINSHAKLRVKAKDENIIRKRYAGYFSGDAGFGRLYWRTTANPGGRGDFR